MIIGRQVLKGFMANIDIFPPLILTFQYNPTSIRDNKVVRYSNQNAQLCSDSPGKMYVGPGDRTISFRMQLHGLEEGTNALNPTALDNGISTELAKLRSFLYPKEDAWALVSQLGGGEGTRVTAPPRCFFGFGLKILECIVTSIEIEEKQFNSLLAPVQADVNVTLVVVEESGNALYEFDKQHRNLLSALGLQNISLF